jgi:hypothetical protein
LPSVSAIETIFKDKQTTFKRYDDEYLNHDDIIYTNQSNKEFKQEDNSIIYLNSFSDPWAYNGRKYWIIKK